MIRLSWLFLMACLMTHAYAQEVFPAMCKPVIIDSETSVLTGGMSVLVMIHNFSDADLWLTHPISDPSASAGFSSRIQPNHWSALALDKKTFEISCVESKPGHEQQIACSSVLAVCKWTDVKIPEKLSGTFWAGEDMPLSELIAYIGRRGFVLSNQS